MNQAKLNLIEHGSPSVRFSKFTLFIATIPSEISKFALPIAATTTDSIPGCAQIPKAYKMNFHVLVVEKVKYRVDPRILITVFTKVTHSSNRSKFLMLSIYQPEQKLTG